MVRLPLFSAGGNNTVGFHLINQAGSAVVADAQLALDIGNAGLTRFQDNGNSFVA